MRSLALLAVALLLALGSCSSVKDPSPVRTPTPSPSSSSDSSTPPTAAPVPQPAVDACYELAFDEALAPTSGAAPVPCKGRHTAQTFDTGRLDAVVAGHLLAVDSRRVQRHVARSCPRAMAAYVGGTKEQRRLSMLRSVWFTPTVAQSDEGSDWYRCDVIAVAQTDRLAVLRGRMSGVLDRPKDRARYAMCATAPPGAEGFQRVVCSRAHTWRAVEVVALSKLPGRDYPGVGRVRRAGAEPCEEAGRAAADDGLAFRWGYEWPTAEQWESGQTYGLCWVPDQSER